jgi:hypothetical protein
MKLSNIVLAGMLVAAAMIVVSVPVAKADGVVDPRIIMNAGMDPSCGGDGEPACYQGGPLTTVFNGVDESSDFVYGCPDDETCNLAPLTSLVLNLTNVSFGAPLSCASDVFVSCTITPQDFMMTDSGPTFTAHVVFEDTVNGVPVDVPSPCVNPYTQGATCAGVIFQGEVIHELIQTPEPASIALLGAGLIGVFGFGRKRWMAAKSL